MVKKLFKHEFQAWLRVLPVIYGIVLVTAILYRVLQVPLGAGSPLLTRLQDTLNAVYTLAALACIPATFCFGIVRFYKNMFTGEGYLTFALPVSVDNHLWVKLVTAVCFVLVSGLVSIISAVIIIPENFWLFLFPEPFEPIDPIVPSPPGIVFHALGYLAELLLLPPVLPANTFLLIYTCICIGQLARKSRILAAVGTYFGIYVAGQFALPFLIVFLSEIAQSNACHNFMNALGDQADLVTAHIVLCGILLLSVLLSGVYYAVCRHIMRNRLNLE